MNPICFSIAMSWRLFIIASAVCVACADGHAYTLRAITHGLRMPMALAELSAVPASARKLEGRSEDRVISEIRPESVVQEHGFSQSRKTMAHPITPPRFLLATGDAPRDVPADPTSGSTSFTGVCTSFNPVTSCQRSAFAVAYNVTAFAAAEGVSASAPVNALCIRGLYFNNSPVPDSWVVTVYEDNGGVPGAVITTFTQGIDLAVTGPAPTGDVFIGRNIQEWNLAFARPINHNGECVWYECRNWALGDSVFQMDGDASNGNRRAAQDLNENGVYDFPAEVIIHDLALCISSAFVDNSICFQNPCIGNLPPNDTCEFATPLPLNVAIAGSIECASTDIVQSCSGIPISPAVWYFFLGTGNSMTVELCGLAAFDTVIEVYCNSCDEPLCVAQNDDFCGLQSSVTFCTAPNATYIVLVHGVGTVVGSFQIRLRDGGVACDNPPPCNPCAGNVCPSGSIAENETCGSATNDGCNVNPTAYQHIDCNQAVCGTSFATSDIRDTDWYIVTAPPSGRIGVTLTADFNAVAFLIDVGNPLPNPCGDLTLVAEATVAACETDSFTASGLVPGREYALFVAPAVFAELPCPATYVVSIDQGLTCGECCDINADQFINSQDLFDFLPAFFASEPAADFNSDSFVNSQDFFDFLTCFFAPPPGCP